MPALEPLESFILGDSSDVTGDLLHVVVGDPTLSRREEVLIFLVIPLRQVFLYLFVRVFLICGST